MKTERRGELEIRNEAGQSTRIVVGDAGIQFLHGTAYISEWFSKEDAVAIRDFLNMCVTN